MSGNNNKSANENFINYSQFQGWGETYRRRLCILACKYLGIPLNKLGSDPSDSSIVSTIKNGLGIGFHSILHTSDLTLEGSSLEKIKKDPALLKKQQELINRINKNLGYKKYTIKSNGTFPIQFGGQRARGEMWKQALGFWKTEYSATWRAAFNELTWTVRSTSIKYNYTVDDKGNITIKYMFSDILDLRPNWGV